MNLAGILHARAAVSPAVAALIDRDEENRRRVTTFAELDAAAGRGATLLREAGLKAGDGVLILQPISLELYVILAAVLRTGLVAMFLDPSAGRQHVNACFEAQPPRGLIAATRAHWLRLVLPALRRIPVKFAVGGLVPGATRWERWQETSVEEPIFEARDHTPALLTFTSGSTGRAKATLRTHGFLSAQHRAVENAMRLGPGEIDLATLPLFVLANLASGMTTLLPQADLRVPAEANCAQLAAQITTDRPTRITASPALLERLAAHALGAGLSWLTLTDVFTGGGPVFPSLLAELGTVAPRARITAVYGSTEAEPIAHVRLTEVGAEDRHTMASGGGLLAGMPVPEISLRIIRDRWGERIGPFTPAEFSRESRPQRAFGEIVVSGDHVLPGYLGDVGNQETKFRVAETPWHRTGDAGYLDTSGRLWLLGRCAAKIIDPHGTIYPLPVEAAAHHQHGVRRAALIACKGERVVAVEASDGFDPPQLLASLRWAFISSIRRVDRLPMDARHNAKVDYARLRQQLEAA